MTLSRTTSAASLVGFMLLCFAVAALGGLSTAEAVQSWYPSLDKPPWTPPNWAFGPIWTFLYASMAIGAWDLLRKAPAPREPLSLFALQLTLNALWSPVFFAARRTGWGLLIIVSLWCVLCICIPRWWRVSRLASVLTVPYLLWVSIATSLNAWIWWFNP